MSHLHAFLLCTLLGFLGGAAYDLLTGLAYPFKNRFVTAVAEGLFCLLFAGLYLLFSLKFALPALRFYHFLGCAAGFFLYLKSVHKTVAFFLQKLYNSLVSKKQKRRDEKCRRKRRSPKRKQNASQ